MTSGTEGTRHAKDPGDVLLSAQRALKGQTPTKLLAYSFNIDPYLRRTYLKAHFYSTPDFDDIENIQVIETEIDADFVDTYAAETEIEIVPAGAKPNFLPGGIAYQRQPRPLVGRET